LTKINASHGYASKSAGHSGVLRHNENLRLAPHLHLRGKDGIKETPVWVERALALVGAMDDQQRRQFHDHYIKLYGATLDAGAAP
jgi:hypothetical protein